MPVFSRLFPPLLLLLLLLPGAHAQRRFEVWYPQYHDAFQTVIRNNCSREWDHYVADDAAACREHFCLVLQLMNCLLANSQEIVKANMANAGVLLGSLPATLGFLGTSTVEIGLLALRRPLLAALLAAASPAVSPLRTIDYRSPHEILRRGVRASALGLGRGLGQPLASPTAAAAALVLQYVLALAAAANLGHVGYQLCVQAVYGFSPAMRVHPALWLVLGLAVHGGGAYAVWLRVRLRTDDEEEDGNDTPFALLPAADEFCLCARQRRAALHARPEHLWFVLVSWATATGTVMHIVYGTLVFSSTLFVGTRDALVVVARFFFSIVVCRVILMFEISGMRDRVRPVEEAQPEEDDDDDDDDGSRRGDSRSRQAPGGELQDLPLLPLQRVLGTDRYREGRQAGL